MNYQAMSTERDRTFIANANVKKGLQVEVYSNFNQLKAIQQEWDDFIESVGSEIFLTYDWCRIWWKHYGLKRKLRIFIFRHENTIVGIIPLFFEKIWLGPFFVRAAKIVGTDFTLVSVSLPVRSEFLSEVLHAFLDKLISEYHSHILYIGPLAGMYGSYNKVMAICDRYLRDGYVIINNEISVQTYFELAGSWEEQISGLSKSQRKKIRRAYRAIQNEKLISSFATLENFEDFFESFVRMHQSRWQKANKGGHFEDWPAAYQFHYEIATSQLSHNRLRLLQVKLGNSVLGYKYGYKFGEKYHAFLYGRSISEVTAHLDLGRILFGEQIKKAINENVRYIDSMQGKYEHKLHLGGELFPIRSLYIVPRKLSTVARVFIFRSLAKLLNLCYYKILFCRIAPKLPFKRKPLWKIWIRSSSFA